MVPFQCHYMSYSPPHQNLFGNIYQPHLQTGLFHEIGPSGVRALPLGVAAERSVLYFGIIFLFFFSVPHSFLPDGVMKFCTEI